MRRNWAALLTLVATTILFGLAIATRDEYDPWRSNLFAGMIGIVLSVFVLRRSLRELLSVNRPSALLAAGLGLGMVAATHLGYQAATWLVPELQAVVETLYLDIEQTSPPLALKVGLILIVVAAEEFIWRGVAHTLLSDHLSKLWIVLFGTLLYALPQLIGGSWLLLCAALFVGTVFGIQRTVHGRLTEALITHGIWSVAIFSLVPLV
jgi:membrane protease YdiL (CAAX protease family)